jgi:hypothetical protein
VNRLDLTETEIQGIPELMENVTSAGARGKTEGAIDAVKEKVANVVKRDDEDEGDDDYEEVDRSNRTDRRRPQPTKKSAASRRRES